MFSTQVKRLQLRPWSEFFDYKSYNISSNTREYIDRLNINLAYYRVNYIIILFISLLYIIFYYPLFILSIIINTSLFYYLFYYRTSSISFSGMTVNRRDMAIAYTVFSILISIAFAGWLFINTTLFMIVWICLHAILRSRSLNARNQTSFIDLITTKPHSDTIRSNDNDMSYSSSTDSLNTIKNNNNNFKSEFRASMRAKYLNKTNKD